MDHGLTELGYVRYGVSDLAEWRTFVETVLGLEIVKEGNDQQLFLRSDMHHHRFELVEDGSDDLLTSGFRVAGAEEFVQIQHTLSAAGVSFDIGSRELAAERHVLELISLEDPAGNPMEIFHGPRVDAHKPFHPSRPMFGRFVTGEGGAGHMILKHAGLDQTYEFYRRLGMRGGVEYKFPRPDGGHTDVLFMHCNSRDHTLAFGVPTTKRVNHLMIEVDNLDDVFLTYEKVEASDYPVVITPGKHANDHMFSFYMGTPSGWQIEIGFAGRPATHQSEYYLRDTYGHRFQGA